MDDIKEFLDALDALWNNIEKNDIPFEEVKKEFEKACDLIPVNVCPNPYGFTRKVEEKYGKRLCVDTYLVKVLLEKIKEQDNR